jgi:hypothetical protein
MIVLQSDTLLVRLDPAHGAEILDVVELENGRQLLGRPPFSTAGPRPGDLEEDVWTESYRGGWQTVMPNAGNPCRVEGEQHGFHGRASNDPWELVSCEPESAVLRWEGHGLRVGKYVSIGDAVRVDYEIESTRAEAAPLVAVDHLCVGTELLEPSVQLDFPVALTYELDERTGPVNPPDGCVSWPEATLLDGSRERVDGWEISQARSRLIVLNRIAAGWAAVRNPQRDQGLALAWDLDFFPHCWVWHENRTTPGVWRSLTELLAVEPASVPHSLGLERAIASGQHRIVREGEVLKPWIVARPCGGTTRVAHVDPDGRVYTDQDVSQVNRS